MSDTDTTETRITAEERARRRAFVAEHRTAIFGYNRGEDGPSMSCVYYVCDGDDLLVSTMAQRAKAKAIARSPKVSLCVLDEQWPPTYLQVYCDASIETDEQAVVELMMRNRGSHGRPADARRGPPLGRRGREGRAARGRAAAPLRHVPDPAQACLRRPGHQSPAAALAGADDVLALTDRSRRPLAHGGLICRW